MSVQIRLPRRTQTAEGKRKGKPARGSENPQCLHPKFRHKVLIGGYIIIHDVTIFCSFPVQKKQNGRKQMRCCLHACLELMPEQRKAVHSLLGGNDILTILPTGYGKSLIFQLFVVAASLDKKNTKPCWLFAL